MPLLVAVLATIEAIDQWLALVRRARHAVTSWLDDIERRERHQALRETMSALTSMSAHHGRSPAA